MENCWAHYLGDCEGELTGEHVISRSILGKTVKVKGFPWCKTEEVEIGSQSLTNNILCKKHNSMLTDFDYEAKNFVSTVNSFCIKNDNFTKFGYRKKDLPIVHKIDGKKLERWCCKTLINVALSQKNDVALALEKIIPMVYQGVNFEKPYGLNFAITPGQKIDTKDFLIILPIFNIKEDLQKELSGGLFVFRGFHLVILIPCSRQNVIIDNKLVLNLGDNLKNDWDNLQLNWHNKNIDYMQPEKRILMQRIKFIW